MVHKTGETANSLTSPGEEKLQVYVRKQAQCKNLSEKFIQTKNNYSKQFAHIYSARLGELRDVLIPRVRAKWGKVPIVKLAELENLEGEECVLIGTLYKHQLWKPSILRELSDDHQLMFPSSRSDYCSEDDLPFLEDEMLRIKLIGEKVNLKEIVTGVVCAILGNENSDGTFTVKEWCFPGCVAKESLKESTAKGNLVIVSGLDLSNSHMSLEVSLFVEWLSGMAGAATVQKDNTSIVRLIIAGNTVSGNGTQSATVAAANNGEILKTVDSFLSNIAMHCFVSLMPGEHDPTNIMLPQRPLHPCLLPKSTRLESFKCVTNPWIGKIEDRVIVGTSGQSVQDIIKATGDTVTSPLEWLEKTLLWRHLCPTAPDTLLACPYYEQDLFIMKECPDIYFVGNAEKFETKLWKGEENQTVRLVSVPNFSNTHTAAIINLENLDARFVSFHG
ncbi:DNA polymerase delta small subunit-like [Ceratina calcarata]|uniref:DNA polymerase delta small subunit-like n=1 Tax=Ceratina calcarata TaxID=156304 RepID=A0AAJ7J8X5_9HYME|nr:DNA polymerase delta small subunit-like [Ceratina calcarata]